MRDLLHASREGGIAALAAIRANGLRSGLTTLGIVIGVAAVIAVVAVMQGLSRNISSQLDDLGSDMVTLRAHTPVAQAMLGVRNRIGHDDFLVLKARVSGVRDMTASMSGLDVGASIGYGRHSMRSSVIGTDSSYQNVVRVYTDQGRFLSESDDERRRRVAVIGTSVVRELNLPAKPVGEFIRLGEEWFRIVGVAEARGSLFGFDQDNWVLTPFSTMRSLHGNRVAEDVEILFRPVDGASLQTIQSRMRQILRARHGLAADAPDPFEFVTAERMRAQFGAITSAVTVVAAGIVGISLLVGGIGIMNIMLVSVTERTREIGIVKALGATPRFILIQFLIEALVLSLIGGMAGVLLGWGLAGLLALMIPGMDGAVVPWSAVALAFGFTTAIGVIFGLAPAVKAARLNPIDALRYE